ncbi:LysR family transcriptional regulator [Cupriavidus basilensis]
MRCSVVLSTTKINYAFLRSLNRNSMETAYLKAFALVVETGSLAEAARRLDVTPAAISQQIQVLERELGTRLLGRAGRTVAPTESGSRLAGTMRSPAQGSGQPERMDQPGR